MRTFTFAAILYIFLLTVGTAAVHNILSALAPRTAISRASVASSEPTLSPSRPSVKDRLELRQAPDAPPVAALPPDVVAPAVPAAVPPAPVDPPAAAPPAVAPPINDPAVAPAAAIPLPAVNPPPPPAQVSASPTSTSTLPLPPHVSVDDLVTVQWVETHIGKLRTWVPKTYTFHVEAKSQAPLPGVGSIGMGTLTGKTGQTQTVYIGVAEAPTPAVDAKKAVVAAVAAGLARLVV